MRVNTFFQKSFDFVHPFRHLPDWYSTDELNNSTGASKIMQYFKKLQLNFIVDAMAFRVCPKSL
jgi:hypothetical protein